MTGPVEQVSQALQAVLDVADSWELVGETHLTLAQVQTLLNPIRRSRALLDSMKPVAYVVRHKCDKQENVSAIAEGGVYKNARERAEFIARQYGGTVEYAYAGSKPKE